jgi:hypothetical protein
MRLLGRSSPFNYWRICINDMTVQLLKKSTLFSVPFQCLWANSRTKPLNSQSATLHMHHHSCHCTVAWQQQYFSTCKMGKRQMDNQENLQPCNFLYHLYKATKWVLSFNAISQLQPEDIFVTRKGPLVSTTLKIRGSFSS